MDLPGYYFTVFWAKALSLRLICLHGLKSVVSGFQARMQHQSHSLTSAFNGLKSVVMLLLVLLQQRSHTLNTSFKLWKRLTCVTTDFSPWNLKLSKEQGFSPKP